MKKIIEKIKKIEGGDWDNHKEDVKEAVQELKDRGCTDIKTRLIRRQGFIFGQYVTNIYYKKPLPNKATYPIWVDCAVCTLEDKKLVLKVGTSIKKIKCPRCGEKKLKVTTYESFDPGIIW